MQESRGLARSGSELTLNKRGTIWLILVLHVSVLKEVEKMRATTSFGSSLYDERQPLLVEHFGHAKGSECAGRAHSY